MDAEMALVKIVIIGSIFCVISAAPEQGLLVKNVTKETPIVAMAKTLYKNATVRIYMESSDCDSSDDNPSLSVTWLVRSNSCYRENTEISQDLTACEGTLITPQQSSSLQSHGVYKKNFEIIRCGTPAHIVDNNDLDWIPYPEAPSAINENTTVASVKKRRDAEARTATEKATDQSKDAIQGVTSEQAPGNVRDTSNLPVANIISEAPYLVIVQLKPYQTQATSFHAAVHIEMKNPVGFLSAHEYPLLTFYMIMCIIYAFYAFAWLVMSACNFRDLLRVQFWIGGVILLGMIEKAVFYSEYLSVNTTGISLTGASKFAEVVSAMKRALARMLVIIVSLGFGIVKPRLGPMLHRVVGIGILYFILAVIEALVRLDSPAHNPTGNNQLLASVPLAVIDSIICWWIFMSLMQTMKTLRLRRNVVKLSLYRHFSNSIIFCVIASLAMILYSFRYRDQCMSDWQEIWIDTAFWHILFSIILLVIMVLWRPNINNQRYAFSPLIDGDGEEDAESGEPMLGGGATENVKMRGLKSGSESNYDPAVKAEEDLKWIEENIPQTVADAALPAVMDSDEEIMTTKYEMSKME